MKGILNIIERSANIDLNEALDAYTAAVDQRNIVKLAEQVGKIESHSAVVDFFKKYGNDSITEHNLILHLCQCKYSPPDNIMGDDISEEVYDNTIEYYQNLVKTLME